MTPTGEPTPQPYIPGEYRHSLDTMIDWLRFLLMIFYAPVRGMRGMRDRGSLAPVALIAFLGQSAYGFGMEKFAGSTGLGGDLFSDVFRAAKIVAFVAIVVGADSHARCEHV